MNFSNNTKERGLAADVATPISVKGARVVNLGHMFMSAGGGVTGGLSSSAWPDQVATVHSHAPNIDIDPSLINPVTV